MPGVEQLRRWRAEAGGLPADLQAAVLLRVARGLSAYDQAEASACLSAGMLAVGLAAGRDREFLLGLAQTVAAAIDPARVREIVVTGRRRHHSQADYLVHTMVDHGKIDAAVQWALSDGLDDSEFPFGMLGALVQRTNDQRTKVALIHQGAEAWASQRDSGLRQSYAFLRTFAHLWEMLPEAEALAVVREIVSWARSRASVSTNSGFGEGITFTSEGESVVFQMMHILRRLDPIWAELVTAEFPQVKAAVQRYPDGLESIRREAAARVEAELAQRQGRGDGDAVRSGVIAAAADGEMGFAIGLMSAAAEADFEESMQFVLEAYSNDTSREAPNAASKEFWPSTHYLRTLICRAGKTIGRRAAGLLSRVPDADLRMLAAIELEAALAGLPEIVAVRVGRPAARPSSQ